MEASPKWVGRFGWLAILALVANAAVASYNVNSLILGERTMLHTREVMGELEGLVSSMKDAETGQRGYLITGEKEYLEPYREALAAVDGRIASLRALVVDDEAQLGGLVELEALVRAKFEILKRNIELWDAQGRDAAREMVLTGEGKRAMDAIRVHAKAMVDRERDLMDARTAAAGSKYRATIVTNLIGASIGILMVLFAYRQIRAEFERRRIVEGEVAEREERFRTLAETAPQIVWAARPDGYHEYFNQRWCAFTGLTVDESQGHNWAAALHPEDLEGTKAAWQHSLRTGAAFEFEYRFRRHDGKYRWFLGLAQPQLDAKGQIIRWIGTLTNIHEQKRTVGELKETRRFLKSVFNAIPAHLAVLEPDGTIITVGDSWDRFAVRNGVDSPGDWAGAKYFHPCGSGSEGPRAMAGIEKVVRGETELFELEYPCHTGDRRHWFQMRAARFAGDGPARVVVSHVDVTARVEAENALRGSVERFRGLTEAMPQLVWTTDPAGEVTWTNRRWDEFLGRDAADMRGTGWQKAIHPDDVAELQQAWARAVRGGADRFTREFRLVNDAGTVRWVRSDAVPLMDSAGEVEQWVGALTDIDDQRREAEHLELRVRERTAELVELNGVLNRTTEELRTSNQELEKFAYVASHDLQEPLRKIQAFGNLLATKYEPVLDDQGRDYIGRMNSSAARMRVLIDDLLLFSRVASKGQAFTTVALDRVLDEVRSDLEVRLAETGGRIDADPLPTIEADATQMRQVFQNLLSNALKFRRKDAAPVIRVSAGRFVDDSGSPGWRLRIADNGIGFEDGYNEKIFEVFQRLHGRGEFEGTGIGLAIVRKIVERHGGRVAAKGSPGQGAVFTIDLPDRTPNPRSTT